MKNYGENEKLLFSFISGNIPIIAYSIYIDPSGKVGSELATDMVNYLPASKIGKLEVTVPGNA